MSGFLVSIYRNEKRNKKGALETVDYCHKFSDCGVFLVNMKKNITRKVGLCLSVALLLIFGLQNIKAQKVSTDAGIVKNSRELLAENTTIDGSGAAVLIVRGDKTVFREARGMANIELSVSLSPESVFEIASITKIFTAALIVKLSENGKLSLDDNLSKFLPDFPNAQTMTIRQLLNHTAGVSDQIPPEYRQPGFSRRDLETATLIENIAKRPSDFAPGTNQAYSNAGYILLGAVIEKVTGKRWYEAMEETFFTPLGLKNTTYGIDKKILKGRASGYTNVSPNRLLENAPFISLSLPAAAGGLVSTLDDLKLWMRLLVDGRVVSKNDFQQMITPASLPGKEPINPYGFGMYVWRVRGETMIGHTGQIDGFTSILAYLPKQDITIVALGNNDNFDAQSFGRRLAAISLGNPYPKVKSVAVSESDLQALAGKYQDGDELRNFFVKDGKLYSQRKNRNPILMQITAEKQIHFVPAELSYFVPVKDSSGEISGLEYYFQGENPPKKLIKIE